MNEKYNTWPQARIVGQTCVSLGPCVVNDLGVRLDRLQ